MSANQAFIAVEQLLSRQTVQGVSGFPKLQEVSQTVAAQSFTREVTEPSQYYRYDTPDGEKGAISMLRRRLPEASLSW